MLFGSLGAVNTLERVSSYSNVPILSILSNKKKGLQRFKGNNLNDKSNIVDLGYSNAKQPP